MKVRNGFVSNSSSSSYIISIKRGTDIEKESALLFDFFIKQLKYSKSFTGSLMRDGFNGTVSQYIDIIKEEQQNVIKDLYWAAKRKEDLEKITKNKDAEKIFNHWILGRGKEYTIRDRRNEEQYRINDTTYLEVEIKYIGHQIERKGQVLIDLKDRLELLLTLDSDEEILDINVDNQDSNIYTLRSIIQDSPWITVIEEELK